MWIVRLALARPYTFVVMSILIAILGGTAIVTMPVDIFPYIDIPVVSVLWVYSGLSPEEMEKRVVTGFERSLTSNVNDIEHIESQSYSGYGVVKIYFHSNVKIDMAVAQVTATMQTGLRQMPPGMFPANVLKYDASSVPILQLGLSSKTLREQEIFDLGNNFIRTPLGTVQGASVSYPFGGKQRSIMVDLNPDELYAKQLSPIDVSNALTAQNLILPAGTAKLAKTEYQVRVNSSPVLLDELNNLPIKTVNGATVYIKDVAQVHDGFSVQNNIVRTNGSRGVLITITRNGKASTLAIVNAVKAALPRILANVTPELKVTALADQSIFVRASIRGVVREALIAAALTGLMILLFLGSLRSTLIVCISIPLSILASLSILNLMGQTINVMTLGGLALAVGILVDDATVEIENTHRNIAMRKPLIRAVLDGASQIAVPTFVATLSICIVFVPVLLLTGTAKYLFTPLALAVVFALMASYLLSRTLVPTMMAALLGPELDLYQNPHSAAPDRSGLLWQVHHRFDAQFERLRDRYVGLLDWALRHRGPFLLASSAFCVLSLGLVALVGEDFFPNVDSGQMRLHARGPAGLRIEETEARFAALEREIRSVIPNDEIDTLIDNIGIPNSWPAIAQGDIPTISAADGEILISLNKEKHGSTRDYEVLLRKQLSYDFPDMTFFFQPANITSQIVNFGIPAPIDLQVVGRNSGVNYKIARQLAERISHIPGAADVHVHQVVAQPQLELNVDRVKASQLGLTQRDVTSSMLISLTGNGSVAPNFWLNWSNGVNYNVGVQTPQYRVNSLDALLRTPISVSTPAESSTTDSAPTGAPMSTNSFVAAAPNSSSQAYANPGAQAGTTQLLSNLVSIQRASTPVIVNHYNVWPVFDVYANVDRRDLGGVGRDVERIMREEEARLPRGTSFNLRGQVETMQSSFFRLGLGMVFAVALVYLLMTVNFQSWVDPFIILTALPGAMAGILWMLFVTRTTLSVPSLMGAIMCVGVATANSILIVTFANDERSSIPSAREAMISAGYARMRPVLMTATAMILGMLPMSLGLGEGGEQNAPLGRAVIGGLLFATVTTLFVVPIIYSYMRNHPPIDHERRLQEREAEFPAGS
ncbi:MAG TPA: efflux RND transporter permease subunit [Bryobacteraceae bacterium]|jgi:multidrug efflux pump subunit AcrB|nr:efflux RND transporter permease subunit [Bryobacteraceae bacterium]